MKRSSKFPKAVVHNKIHYFVDEIKPSKGMKGIPFETQAVYYDGKWRQDTMFITEEFKNQLEAFNNQKKSA